MSGDFPAIEVRDVRKSFRMRVNHAREPSPLRLRARGYRFEHVPVLDGVSFDVGRGELFGVVGRNGSGKSTLLKILASIYDADGGRVRMVGRRAPFVELGLGFHPELTAWDNVRTNSVMMGLTPRQASERFERIMEFAELEEFRGLELKHYSAGMRTRLAFAGLLEVDADIFLFDEILAAGDVRFQEKSAAAFDRLREQGRTIVLVSHSLGAVKRKCDRALLLHEGRVEQIGDPEEVTMRYLELHSGQGRQDGAKRPPLSAAASLDAPPAEITDAWLEDSAGRVAAKVPTGERLRIHALVEVSRGGREPAFACEIHDGDDGSLVKTLDAQPLGGSDRLARPRDRLHAHVAVGGNLAPGSYIATCRVLRAGKEGRRVAMTEPKLLEFAVSRAGRTQPAPAAREGTELPDERAAASL